MGFTTMTRRLICLAVAIVLTGAGCSIFKSETENDLDAAMALWEANGYASYSMSFERICLFCGPLGAIVYVEAGLVVDFEDVTVLQQPLSDSLQAISNITVADFESVEGLFSIIASSITSRADFVEVTYHAGLGYPASIHIDPCSDCYDSSVSYTVSDVVEVQ